MINRSSCKRKAFSGKFGGLLCCALLLLASCNRSPRPSRILFFSVATESEEHYHLSRKILDQVRRFVQPRDFVSIDQQQKGRASILYASPGNRREISSVAHALPKGIENNPEASLLEAAKRLRQYAADSDMEIYALIITEGTDDAKTLATLKSINAEIAALGSETVHSICVLGLNPQLRQTTSSAFSPLKDRIQSGLSQVEWKRCVNNMRS